MKYTDDIAILACDGAGAELSLDCFSSNAAILSQNELLKINTSYVGGLEVSYQDLNSDAEFSFENGSSVSTCKGSVTQDAFEGSKSRWIDDSVIRKWRNPEHKIHKFLLEVDGLYNEWRTIQPAPFALSPDPVWLDTGRALASIGLPWHNNQVNLPNEIDTSWPFHFKEFEAQLIQAKGTRVGDPNASGYVTSYDEANLYCIRALQQELRKQCPTSRPVLVYDRFDTKLILSMKRLFGLETHQVSLSSTIESLRHELLNTTANATRPIIFAASLYNSNAEHDALRVICQISQEFPLMLHVDAFQSFDYMTLGLHNGCKRSAEKLKLAARDLRQPLGLGDTISASTIVAGGLNHPRHFPAIALKPASIGEEATRVAYIRAFDSTLSGSRDAIGPLWTALYERRLGDMGLRGICQYLISLRSCVTRILERQNIPVIIPPYSTDVVIPSCTESGKKWLMGLGGTMTEKGEIILSMNPRSSPTNLCSLLIVAPFLYHFNPTDDTVLPFQDFVHLHPIPRHILFELETKIQSWQIRTRSTTGYPVHMGSCSTLGPVIGLSWDLEIPRDWIERRADEILASTMKSFGLVSPEDQKSFRGVFTNGSTMGNRIGIMTALAHFPNAFVYFSVETHYSVIKTLRDCDTLTSRWVGGRPRYSQIRCSSNGSILVAALLGQALADKERCIEDGIEYHMILLANMGTTFVGAKDNLVDINRELTNAGIQISYIHVDGALDFGFDTCGIKLGPCGAVGEDGRPLVQGITVSHHKVLGNMVSGEVVCYNPGNHGDELPDLWSSLDPRAVFETWFYKKVYEPSDLALMSSYCHKHALHLETSLKTIGVVTKESNGGIIIVLERPPSWIIEKYSLRPEGDWVHFITMPHVSKEIVDGFIDELSSIDKQFSLAFSHITPLLSENLGTEIKLKRIRCCSSLAKRVLDITKSLIILDNDRKLVPDSTLNIKSNLRSAISVVAVNNQDEIQVVFLARSNRDHSISVGPLLIRDRVEHTRKGIVDIGKLLMGLLSRHLKARINMALRERTGMNRTNILESYVGTIRIGNRWPRRNQSKGPPDLPENFRTSKRVARCLDALQVLQFKRNQYLLGETLAVPLQFLHDSLPYMVQRDVNIFQPIHEDIWTTPFKGTIDGIDDAEIQEFIEISAPVLPGRRYHFWPIDMNQNGVDGALPHWGLIVLHLVNRAEEGLDETMSDGDELVGPYNYLDAYAVITPDHGPKARALENDIANTLITLLPSMGIGVDQGTHREYPWVPPSHLLIIVKMNAPQITPPSNREHWSSGIRVFEMIRVWLDRLTKLYCENPHWHNGFDFWAAHPGWVNVDAVRAIMVGLSAEMVNRAMDHTTRIAIEPMLDYEMQNTHTGEVIRTRLIAPSRRRIGAFLPNQTRKSPVWLEDTPGTQNITTVPVSDTDDVDEDVKEEDSDEEGSSDEGEEDEEDEEEGEEEDDEDEDEEEEESEDLEIYY
ncbi:hypothetical protein O1611_g1201 [Lasiodiplodia mahajangana]|uniref:Uncharacterized protein n=1 Tax=Lasiodiplodia mahajangana TaxID=1108764 RepID=A0ACC2JYC9_9PEZI|nr:hypothetical protein O1611_g1201 [Lasiodiplodia mahajangana]